MRFDARTGNVQLPDLGVTTTAAVERQGWLGTPGGEIDVVKVGSR